jgi:XTP/dITP diphosphohydrolase
VTVGRLVMLATSPRVAPGLLSWDAWSALRAAGTVLAAAEHPLLPYLEAAGVRVTTDDPASPYELARRLVARATTSTDGVVWLVDPDASSALGEALGDVLVSVTPAPELEVLPGSYDVPGSTLVDLVAVMHRLRSPGGCPWDAEQTHESLVTYLVEETYETVDAIETGDRSHLREELGDLLLQVVFHSRIAQEHPDDPWSVDDVAGDIVAKLVRRHPHVFGDAEAPTAEHVEARWELLKAAEKGRGSAVEGVPMGLPALVLAAKLMSRAERAGVPVAADPEDASWGGRLLALVAEARAAGADPESELRAAARRFAAEVRAAEESGPD